MKVINAIRVIEMVEATPGKNDKIQILQTNRTKELEELLDSAYNPFKVYKIKHLDFKKSAEYVYRPKLHNEFLTILDLLQHNNVNTTIREAVTTFLEKCAQPQQSIYYRIITKDLTIGITLKSVNKAFGDGFIPDFKIMKASPLEDQDLEQRLLVQPKLDGYRCLIVKDDCLISCYTSNGKVIPLPEVERELIKIEGSFVLDGELVSTSRTGTSTICGRLIKGNTNANSADLTYHMFDLVNFNEFKTGKFTQTCEERLLLLEVLGLNNKLKYCKVVPTTTTNSSNAIQQLYRQARENKEEGIIVKPPGGLYETKRSKNWLKVKAINSCTLKVVNIVEHSKVKDTLGSFTCISEDERLQVSVGGGFSDEDREVFWSENVVGKYIEVLYNEVQITKDGDYFMFLPRFKEVRVDKDEADTLDKILSEER